MNTAAGRNARPQPEADRSRASRRHTHTQHALREQKMLLRAARREMRHEVAAW